MADIDTRHVCTEDDVEPQTAVKPNDERKLIRQQSTVPPNLDDEEEDDADVGL